MFKKLIVTVMGLIAGLEFLLLILSIKNIFVPNFEFSSNLLIRFPLLIIFFVVIGVFRSYLIENEKEEFTNSQIRLMIILTVIFVVTVFIFKTWL